MPKRRKFFRLGFIVVVLLAFSMIVYTQQRKTRSLTFAECESMGGEAWLVDLYHPDICSSCAEYRACETAYNDYHEACPECYGACQECQDQYSLSESCPECYGPCQACQNQYLNDFENDAERYELCPECEQCDACRTEIETQRANCPPCVSCNACKEANKKYTSIEEVCPQITPCVACLNANSPYPDRCPDGREKLGEISDAAIWFMCCK